jgi:hypothetical protein
MYSWTESIHGITPNCPPACPSPGPPLCPTLTYLPPFQLRSSIGPPLPRSLYRVCLPESMVDFFPMKTEILTKIYGWIQSYLMKEWPSGHALATFLRVGAGRPQNQERQKSQEAMVPSDGPLVPPGIADDMPCPTPRVDKAVPGQCSPGEGSLTSRK